MALFEAPQGQFQLERSTSQQHSRQPTKGHESNLQAWDAADSYLLHWLNEQGLDKPGLAKPHTLVLNDNFGALTTAIHSWQPSHQTDSYLAQQACRQNLLRNQLNPESVTWLNSLETPATQPGLVLLKIPKTLALLEDQLYRLRPLLSPDCLFAAGVMVKYLSPNVFRLFEKIIGPVTTSLAQKKSRLLFCKPDAALLNTEQQSPYPTQYQLEDSDFVISNHANVFSRASLDIGTRLMLKHLPEDVGRCNIIDLGCGNGLLGLLAAANNPEARLQFYDESYMAIASAEANFRHNLGADRQAQFQANDCLAGVADQSADWVLNNPPFHQQQTIGDHIAWQMFKDSHRVLKTGGCLQVIGNRHLNYHVKLKRLFGNCHTVASDRKFVVLKAVKR
jgi:16S rRNA (guanine1207-N2)-methyltransferase